MTALTAAPARAARATRPSCRRPVTASAQPTQRRTLLLTTGLTVLLGAGPALASPLNVGDVAPEFALPSTTGGVLSLESLKQAGKWTVAYFYNQDFSPGCSLEAARFQNALPAFAAVNAQVVGISMDTLEKHTEAAAKPASDCASKSLTFPLLSDGTGAVSKAYDAFLDLNFLGKYSDRQTFLVDPKGVVRAKWSERDGGMASVKSPAHTEQVLAAIKAAQEAA